MSGFKGYSLEARKKIYQQYTHNHPDSIPLIIEPHKKSQLGINNYFKLMAKKDFTFNQLTQIIYRKLKNQSQILTSDPTLSIHLFCKGRLVIGPQKISELLLERDPDDMFLYLIMSENPTF